MTHNRRYEAHYDRLNEQRMLLGDGAPCAMHSPDTSVWASTD